MIVPIRPRRWAFSYTHLEAMLEANPEDSRAKMLLENFDAVLDRPNDQDLEALTNWARSL